MVHEKQFNQNIDKRSLCKYQEIQTERLTPDECEQVNNLTNIDKAKETLGKTIREIAEGYGALKSNSAMTRAEEICANSFEKNAGEWVYEFIKKVVLDGSNAWEDEKVPKFLVLDYEEEWASYITSERFMT